jgi:hypothetical protein
MIFQRRSSLETKKNDSFLTIRSFIAGASFTAISAVMDQYSSNVIHASSLAIDHMAVAAVFLFFILLLFLQLFLNLLKNLSFTEAELLGVYIMGFVGCTVVTMGLGSYLLPIIAAPKYYASSQNHWEEILGPYLKQWMMPQDKASIEGFFEGIPRNQAIPWRAWVSPLIAWFPFLISLYLTMICIPILMRKQWVERERLLFPLAEIPLEMAKTDERGFVLLRNKTMWLGFIIPFTISTIIALHRYNPLIPAPNLANYINIFRNTEKLWFRISFPVIGFLFFASKDVSFSLWFFALLTVSLTGWINIVGLSSTENMGVYGSPNVIFNHIGTGAIFVYVFFIFWVARKHLQDIFRKAFFNAEVDDSREILPFRTALIVLLVSLVFMVVWLSLSGLSPLMAIIFIIIMLVIFLGVTRVVIEGGVPTLIAPGIASAQLVSSVGSNAIGSSGLASLGFTFAYSADIRTFVMSAASNSLKISERIRDRRNRIFWAMLTAVITALVTTLVVSLFIGYRYGGINLNNWYFVAGPQVGFNFAKEYIVNPGGANLSGWVNKIIGASVMGMLLFMRARFLWWHLHPIGWIVGSSIWIQYLWFSIFTAWFLKSLIMRYGGVKIYTGMKPFFLGLILGQYVAAALWFVIDYFTGMTGNSVFWI